MLGRKASVRGVRWGCGKGPKIGEWLDRCSPPMGAKAMLHAHRLPPVVRQAPTTARGAVTQVWVRAMADRGDMPVGGRVNRSSTRPVTAVGRQ